MNRSEARTLQGIARCDIKSPPTSDNHYRQEPRTESGGATFHGQRSGGRKTFEEEQMNHTSGPVLAQPELRAMSALAPL